MWYMRYWPSVRLRYLDIGRVLLFISFFVCVRVCVFIDWDKVQVLKYAKKWARLIFNHLHLTLAQWRIYHIEIIFRLNKNKEWLFVSRTGKEADCVCGTINPRETVGVSFFLPIFCRFLRLHHRHCQKITNFVSLLHETYFLARNRNG